MWEIIFPTRELVLGDLGSELSSTKIEVWARYGELVVSVSENDLKDSL